MAELDQNPSIPATSMLFLYHLCIFLNIFLNTILAYLGIAFRDLIYLHDSQPTFIGPNQNLINISKVAIYLNYLCLLLH